jgi:hypothetical protein
MPQFTITVLRPEVAVSTTQNGPSVTINETPVEITQNTSTIAVSTAPQVVEINTNATTIQTTTLDEAFQGEFSLTYTYHRGDLVRYEQGVYVYIDTTPRTTLAPDVATDYWVLLFSESGLTGPQVTGINRAINLTVWDPATSYSVGDIVIVNETHDTDGIQNQPFPVLYRLYSAEGAINTNPLIHHDFPTYTGSTPVYDVDSSWQRLVGVVSINGFSGDVELNSDNIPEGSINLYYTTQRFEADFAGQTTTDLTEGNNLYYTVARWDSRLATKTTDDLTEGTANLYWTTTRGDANFDTRLATKTTTNLAEGTNLYYTDARVDARVAATIGTIDYPVDSVNGQTGTVVLDTDDVSEGATNLYYTNARFDSRLATKDTDDLAEGSRLYYTTARANGDFDARLATKNTGALAEGTNLYYTTARANSDFDTRLATKSTTNLAEGTNQYYTNTRARGALSGSTGITYNNTTGAIAIDDTVVATHTYVGTQIANLVASAPSTLDTLNELAAALGDDPNFATTITTALGSKLNTADFTTTANTWYATSNPIQNNNTDDLSEGTTNKYYTETRATNNFNTNLSLADTNDLAEGTTNKYYTDGRARNAISATGDISYDPNTGVISYTDTGGAVDSVNGQTGVVVLDTDDVSEGTTNKYYTDGRSRNAISLNNVGITAGLTYNSSTGVLSYVAPSTDDVAEGIGNLYFTYDRARDAVANGVDLAVDGSNAVYVKSVREGTRVKGALESTRNDSYTFPITANQQISGNNGFDVASSGPDAAGPKGYSAGNSITHYFGDTDAGVNTTASTIFRTAQGTNSAPSAINSGNTMGTFNWSGYSGTDFASVVSTVNGGGGRQSLHPLQLQGYANQGFAESTISVTTTATIQQNLTIGSVSSSGNGVFTNTSGDIRQYDVVRVTGTLTGTMTFPGYVSGNIYYVIAGANPTTTFTLSTTQDGDAITTGAGTTTGLTFVRHRSLITFAAQTAAPFGTGGLLTVAGITPAGYNGTHRAVYGTTTQVAYGNYQTGTTQTVAGTVSQYNVTAGGSGFRIRGFANSVPYNTSTRINFIDANATAATYRSDLFTWQGATNTFNYMQLSAGGATFNTGGITIKDLAGTSTYYTLSILKAVSSVPVRSSITDGGNFAGGSTYTPLATANNSIKATINSGTGGLTIALTNLTATATDGGHYQILVTNTTGTAQQVQTTGGIVNTNHNLGAGASMMITVYVVGTSAFCEHLV